MLGSDYKELLHGDEVLLFLRNGIWQARVYTRDRRYIFKSLKTTDIDVAREAATQLFYDTRAKLKNNIPVRQRPLNKVIDEYVAQREIDYELALKQKGLQKHENAISVHMLRQIKRVVKFLREFCGTTSVDRITANTLKEYVNWRRNYYVKMEPEQRPRNAKLNPADKTLEWEVGLAKTILKFANDKGYTGRETLFDWRYKTKKKIVRPAFEVDEYRRLWRGALRWIKEEENEERKYVRQLLLDYILILANSGMRPGEANALLESDVVQFTDPLKHENFRLYVKGKTGARTVIPRTTTHRVIQRVLARNEAWKQRWAEKEGNRAKNRKQANKANWLFRMSDGNKVITLIDQFNALLAYIGMTENRYGEKFSIYSLRHFYATHQITKGRVPIFDLAKNMGTSVQVIESYYGKSATTDKLTGTLGL